MYADDTIILSENEAQLQLSLNVVHTYCTQWKLTVNTDKTKIIIFSRGKVRKFPVFSFGENNISVVSDYVYLGVTFNYNNKFAKAIKKQLDQARRAMFSLLVKARRLLLPVDIHRSTPNGMTYGDVGRLRLQVKIDKLMIGYWLRILSRDVTTLTHIFYSMSITLFNSGQYTTKWTHTVKSILDNCGLTYMWIEQNDIDPFKAKHIVCKRIEDVEIQKWHTTLSTSPMCSLYVQFKTICEFESYLLFADFRARILITKFRCRNFKLPVKTSTYLPISNMCDICNNGTV